MYNGGLHHASPTLSNSDDKVQEVRTVVWHSVIRPRHVLQLFHQPLLLARRLHSHTAQHNINSVWPFRLHS